jgi:hypothetical protein
MLPGVGGLVDGRLRAFAGAHQQGSVIIDRVDGTKVAIFRAGHGAGTPMLATIDCDQIRAAGAAGPDHPRTALTPRNDDVVPLTCGFHDCAEATPATKVAAAGDR